MNTMTQSEQISELLTNIENLRNQKLFLELQLQKAIDQLLLIAKALS